MRRSLLGIQTLCPDGKALSWALDVKPRIFKLVMVGEADYTGWMPKLKALKPDTLIVARWLPSDSWDWTEANARTLAKVMKRLHENHDGVVDVWECINEPVATSIPSMKRLAHFERVWAEEMRSYGLRTAVGNFAMGNPEPELMPYFRPALEVATYFNYHSYSCPSVLHSAEWLALRYRKLLDAAGYHIPVILGECGIDCNLRGYRKFTTDEDYVQQLIALDQQSRSDDYAVEALAIYCYGTWDAKWQSFNLSSRAAMLLGDYIVGEGDVQMATDTVRLWRRDSHGQVQNLHIEEYLRGVVPAEVNPGWPAQALMAQSIAARSYAKYWIQRGGKHCDRGADLCSEACCQVYRPWAIDPRSDAAVSATRGIYLRDWRGLAYFAQYVSTCGLPDCPYCQGQGGYQGRRWYGRLCQHGAKRMAEQGKSWRDILAFYYPKATIPESGGGNVEDAIRNRCWNDAGIAMNPNAAFFRKAKALGLGRPVTNEGRIWVGGVKYAYQGFDKGILYCREGDWGHIRKIGWF